MNNQTLEERLAGIAENAVTAQVQAAISTALSKSDHGSIIEQVVSAALTEQVQDPKDKYGRTKRAWIDWLVRDQLRQAVQKAVVQMLDEQTDAIRAEVERQLALKTTQRTLAKQLIEKATDRSYDMKIILDYNPT